MTIAVLAIIVSLAAPNLRNTIENNRLSATTNDLIASFQFARSEAIRRNVSVEVCATTEPDKEDATCDGVWHQGWIVVDPDAGADRRLRSHAAVRGLEHKEGPTSITFNASGRRDPDTSPLIRFETDNSNLAIAVCTLESGRSFSVSSRDMSDGNLPGCGS